MLRYILNGVQGENQAIEGIIDRIDGKINSKNGNGDIETVKVIIVNNVPNIPDREKRESGEVFDASAQARADFSK